jgi:hypothetical protein
VKAQAGNIIAEAYYTHEKLREDLNGHLAKNGELAVLALKKMSQHVTGEGGSQEED